MIYRSIGEPAWTRFKAGDRVKLEYPHHGFPTTVGKVLNTWPHAVEVLFDGEDSYRVLPHGMIEHACQDEMQSADACGTVQSQTHEAMEVSAPHSFKSDEQVQHGEVLSLR